MPVKIETSCRADQLTEQSDYNVQPIECKPRESDLNQVTQESSSTLSVGKNSHLSMNSLINCSNPDYLASEPILERPPRRVTCKDTNIPPKEKMLPTDQAPLNPQSGHSLQPLHKQITATTMFLAMLAFHGIFSHVLERILYRWI